MTPTSPERVTCPRCQALDGAHFGWCYLAQVAARALGPDLEHVQSQTLAPLLAPLVQGLTTLVREAVAQALASQQPASRPTTAEDVAARLQTEAPAAEVPEDPGLTRKGMADRMARARDPERPATKAPQPNTGRPRNPGTVSANAKRAQKAAQRRAEADTAIELFCTDRIEKADPSAYVPLPDIVAAYNAWRPTVDAPEVPVAWIGSYLRAQGHGFRQARTTDDRERFRHSLPMLYFGLALRPVVPSGERDAAPEVPTPATVAARHLALVERHDPKAQTEAIRALMKPPAPVVAAEPEHELEPEAPPARRRRHGANGWTQPRAFANLDVTTLDGGLTFSEGATALQVQSEADRYVYDGPRPGKEMPKEYRDLIAPLLQRPGWRYAPHNSNGKGKPRIWNPDGAMYCLPNTPSDVKGLMACKTMLNNSLGAGL